MIKIKWKPTWWKTGPDAESVAILIKIWGDNQERNQKKGTSIALILNTARYMYDTALYILSGQGLAATTLHFLSVETKEHESCPGKFNFPVEIFYFLGDEQINSTQTDAPKMQNPYEFS